MRKVIGGRCDDLEDPTNASPSESLRAITEAWLDEIQTAIYRQAATALSSEPVIAAEVIEQARREKEPQFDAAYKRCLESAMTLGTQSEVLPLLDWTRHAIASLERESVTDPIRSYIRHEQSGGEGTPWLNAKARGEWLVKAFVRMAPLMDGVRGTSRGENPPQPATPPLTDRQQQVWDLLEGQVLSAQELADKLSSKMTPEGVRQLVMQIRRVKPDIILSRPGRGYYRPDKPPPHMS